MELSSVMGAGVAGLLLLAAASCARDDGFGPGDGGADASDAGVTCQPCVVDTDCQGGVCAQIGGDSYCATSCPNGNECGAGTSCTGVTTAEGQPSNACVPSDNCGSAPPTPDAGPGSCPGLADPNTPAGCSSCSGKNCQPNGCYGGWWCDTNTSKCQAPPQNCGSAAGDGGLPDAGQVTGSIDGNGGTETSLYFAVVGDTRPPTIDDTSGYPSSVIGKIFSDIAGLTTPPPFAVATGDYMFASTYGAEAQPQLDLYVKARSPFQGVEFPAMGNHECTGATASNCGSGNKDGVTKNYSAFLSTFLQPLGKSTPYYSVNVHEPNNAWTAKFVFIAANAWDSAQSSWLSQTLAQKTTYTFVVRHEAYYANTAPGVPPSETIIAKYPLTLEINGHTHKYDHYPSQHCIIVGNGGAPLTSTSYGFALVTQRNDGAIQVDMINSQTLKSDTSYRFAVHPDGSPAP